MKYDIQWVFFSLIHGITVSGSSALLHEILPPAAYTHRHRSPFWTHPRLPNSFRRPDPDSPIPPPHGQAFALTESQYRVSVIVKSPSLASFPNDRIFFCATSDRQESIVMPSMRKNFCFIARLRHSVGVICSRCSVFYTTVLPTGFWAYWRMNGHGIFSANDWVSYSPISY